MDLSKWLEEHGWDIAYVSSIPEREQKLFSAAQLPLSKGALRFLEQGYHGLVYLHQREALQKYLSGENVCITTAAASGKSLVFQTATIDLLEKERGSRVLALYPLKALGREQEDRWNRALTQSGLDKHTRRIDGGVSVSSRLGIVRQSDILLLTPDIVHAWLLSNLHERALRRLLRDTRIVVVDEVHTYAGVFGSNAAFLFRRLAHVMSVLGAKPQYITASATIDSPEDHLSQLFGKNFSIIGDESDTSPRHPLELIFVTPPSGSDLLTECSGLIEAVVRKFGSRSIVFVDSRKQTEHMAAIAARWEEPSESEKAPAAFDHLRELDILPFRAGYESHDREVIQRRLSEGSLGGVISTSALELGIDIPSLETAILIGVPPSMTAFRQRIGRVGRRGPGRVIIVNTGSVLDEEIFGNPEALLSRPLAMPALYLDNKRIQYIHAMCLARQGGEHDQVVGRHEADLGEFKSDVDWPDGFLEMCRRERTGEVPADLQQIRSEGGDRPNYVFPLRDVESQFRVELRQGREVERLGSLSYSQLMREAYPGAVYYYTTRPFRVYKLNLRERSVYVRREKKYTTRPTMLPAQIFPNLSAEGVHRARRFGELTVIECDLQVRESVQGYRERRGPNEFVIQYPIDGKAGIYWDRDRLTRLYFTTGTLLAHPGMEDCGSLHELAQLLLEAFLIHVPIERHDISCATGVYRGRSGVVKQGQKFIVLYDQTYGSLRISERFATAEVLTDAFGTVVRLLAEPSTTMGSLIEHDISDIRRATEALAELVNTMRRCVAEHSESACGVEAHSEDIPPGTVRVIAPGGKGVNLLKDNEEFLVDEVICHPQGGVGYRGRYTSTPPDADEIVILYAENVEPIPGECEIVFFDPVAGEIVSDTSE